MTARPGKSLRRKFNSLACQVERVLLTLGCVADRQRLLVAVSGGLDSMVLLDVLRELAPAHGWSLVVAHFNHCLRGRSSDADEALVARTAKALKLPVSTGRADVKAFARRKKISIEMAARDLRHKFLAQTARRRKTSIVVLAHHAGDQAELFFLRLLRGAATEGLGGMRSISSSPADKSVQLVRPLLGIERGALERHAREHRIEYRQDASNFDISHLRNRVRHEIIPALKQQSPALEQTVSRLMEIARAESDLVQRLLADWLKTYQPGFEELDVALQRRHLVDQLTAGGTLPEFDLVERLRLMPDQPVTIPGGRVLIRRRGTGRLEEAPGCLQEFRSDRTAVRIGGRGRLTFGPVQFGWRVLTGGNLPTNASNCEYFDAGAVGPRVTLRHWQAGDRYQPIGMACSVKLQDLFTNLKVPRALRFNLVVALDANGRIFWVEGCRISELHKVTDETPRLLRWSWVRQTPLSLGCSPPSEMVALKHKNLNVRR